MKILDKNTDFYDFYQNVYRDDTYTFDRTASFFITKEMVCDILTHRYSRRYWDKPHKGDLFLSLVQVCNDFWVIALEVSKVKDEEHIISDVDFTLISHFKDYNKERKLISVDIIDRRFCPSYSHVWGFPNTVGRCLDRADDIVMSIKNGYSESKAHFGPVIMTYPDGTKKEKTIPLLIASGFVNCIEPLDIYNAFEEYFSLKRSSAERTESVGLTDKEKIANHGFDAKISFRGKN